MKIFNFHFIIRHSNPSFFLYNYLCNVVASSKSASFSSNLAAPLHMRHLQQTIHGATSNNSGDATSNSIPNPAKIPERKMHLWNGKKKLIVEFSDDNSVCNDVLTNYLRSMPYNRGTGMTKLIFAWSFIIMT